MCPRRWHQSLSWHQSFSNRPSAWGNTNISTLAPMVRERVWCAQTCEEEVDEVEDVDNPRREYQKMAWCHHHQEFHNSKMRRWSYQCLTLCVTGFSFSTGDYKEKEDMYDEIIHLKKARHFFSWCALHFYNVHVWICVFHFLSWLLFLQSLQAQKLDNQQMKVKLRRLEEDNAKREKQIEELLDPTKVWPWEIYFFSETLKSLKKLFFSLGIWLYAEFSG